MIRRVAILLTLALICLSVSALASPEMSPDGRSCYAPGCHQHGDVDGELKKILAELGDTIDDPDPALIVVKHKGGAEEAEAQFTPGDYTAEDVGMEPLSVTMTFTENEITTLKFKGPLESPAIGGKAAETVGKAILDAQSADEIDAVSHATKTSSALIRAAQSCIAQAKGEEPVPAETTAQ